MVLVFVKNLLFPHSHPPANETPPLLPTVEDYATDFTTPSKNYGTNNNNNIATCSPNSATCSHPSCPKRNRTPSITDGSSSSGQTPKKPYFDPRVLSDLTIGLSDGLTVPFALTAGLSAFNDTKVVLYGGIAELIAGSISMGLGGWLAGRGEAEFYQNTLNSTITLITTSPASVPPLLHSIFTPFHLPECSLTPLITSLASSDTDVLTSFIMQFHHRLPAPEEEEAGKKRTPLSSAVTIAAGYFFGGFVPLMPYFFVERDMVIKGLEWSVGVMVACLFVFGVGKTVLVGEGGRWKAVRGGVEMVLVGGVAAAAAMGIVRALGVS